MQCPRCRSRSTIKRGSRYTTAGSIQRYGCQDCGYRFSETTLSFIGRPPRMTAEMTVYALDLYLRGHSSRAVAKRLYTKFGVTVCFNTVLRYVDRLGLKKPDRHHSYSAHNIRRLRKIIRRDYASLRDRLAVLESERLKIHGQYLDKLAEIDRKIEKEQARIERNRAHRERIDNLKPRPKQVLDNEMRRRIKHLKRSGRAYFERKRAEQSAQPGASP